MNIANKLTVLRVLLVPVFMFFLLTDMIDANIARYIALGVFVIASLTDFLDGHLARSRNLVTDFGKFMDPLADKLLVTSALVCFTFQGTIGPWVTMIIIARDFIISGFRLVAANAGVVLAASWWGKIKTVTQMLMIMVILLSIQTTFMVMIENVLIWAAVILTVVSLIDYMWSNKGVITIE